MGFKGFIIDLDGVVCRGDELIPNAGRRITALKKKAKVLFLTNNSTKTRAEYVDKLRGFGLDVNDKEVITSGYAAALYIRENYKNPNVFVIGEDGLKKELEWQGIRTGLEDCNIVLVGLDRDFNYSKIALALKFIQNGAQFIATNTDNVLITESGMLPGAGTMVSSVQTVCEEDPIVIGKPSEIVAKIALETLKLKPAEVLVIGDRLETDIAMGKKAGMKTALVLTGYSKIKDIEKTKIKPDHVIDKL